MDRLSDDVKLAVTKTVMELADLVEAGRAVTASRLIAEELEWPRTPNEKVTDFMRWQAEEWETAKRGPLCALWWMFGAIIREGSKKMTTGFAADLRALIKEAGEKDGLTVNVAAASRPGAPRRWDAACEFYARHRAENPRATHQAAIDAYHADRGEGWCRENADDVRDLTTKALRDALRHRRK